MSPDICVDAARRANDRLAEICARHPTRFAGFAALPTPVPDKAVDELERCVTQLGLKGAMIHGLTNGVFLDDKRFWPILGKAQALGVPLYMHPSLPHPDVMRVYYDDYAKEFPMVIRAAWGFTVETATAAIRLILSRAFESFPDLDIILGHFGETLPFVLWRINQALARSGQGNMNFREQFTRHFHVTTSGAFSTPALVCTMLELGIDRIMFSVDYPYAPNANGRAFLDRLSLAPADMAKLTHGNADALLKLNVRPE
jgi:2,3-dihydroxybenzoate decarboxylase